MFLAALISELCKEDTVNSTVWLDLLDKAVQLCENLPLASPSKDNKGTLVSEVHLTIDGINRPPSGTFKTFRNL